MKAIELFAGIGGIALAAEWAGIETVAFCERDEFCQKVLNKHWPNVPIFDDVCTLNSQALQERGVDIGSIELISGGFPCQPYSIAGKQRGKKDDRDLWPEMFRTIKEIKPTWVVGENVAHFANMELDRTLFDLESIGYQGKSFIIPACAVNAKHRRDRTFIVAYTDVRYSDEKSKSQTYQTFGAIRSEGDAWKSSSRKSWRNASRTYWKTNKPPVCGVADGVPGGLDKDRLKSLGNAVVPQQIYPIFKYIKLIHEQMAKEVIS